MAPGIGYSNSGPVQFGQGQDEFIRQLLAPAIQQGQEENDRQRFMDNPIIQGDVSQRLAQLMGQQPLAPAAAPQVPGAPVGAAGPGGIAGGGPAGVMGQQQDPQGNYLTSDMFNEGYERLVNPEIGAKEMFDELARRRQPWIGGSISGPRGTTAALGPLRGPDSSVERAQIDAAARAFSQTPLAASLNAGANLNDVQRLSAKDAADRAGGGAGVMTQAQRVAALIDIMTNSPGMTMEEANEKLNGVIGGGGTPVDPNTFSSKRTVREVLEGDFEASKDSQLMNELEDRIKKFKKQTGGLTPEEKVTFVKEIEGLKKNSPSLSKSAELFRDSGDTTKPHLLELLGGRTERGKERYEENRSKAIRRMKGHGYHW